MAGYIGTKAAVSTPGSERKFVFDISTTTTSITGVTYTPNHVHVFHNGIRLVDGTDYTATNGNSITLTNAAQSGDQIVVVSYATYQNADSYTKAEADSRYVDATNGALAGTFSLSGSSVSLQVADPQGYPRFNGASSSAQIGLFRSSGGTEGGFYIGADAAQFSVWDSGFVRRLNVDSSGRVMMPYQPAFMAVSSAAGNAGASGNLVFANVPVNIGNSYNPSTGYFTAPISGVYQFSAHILSRSGGYSYAHFRKNGANYVLCEDTGGSSGFRETSGTMIIQLAANDTVNIYSPSATYGAIYDWFSGHLIG